MFIKELGSGKYSDCFKIYSQHSAVAMKLSYYQEATIRAYACHTHNGNDSAALAAKEQDSISVSMAVAEVAKQLRERRVTPHIVRVYCEADVRYLPKRLKPLLRARLSQLTQPQLKYSHVCLMELYSCTFTRFLTHGKPTDHVVKALVFQIMYTLGCLHELFPGFRHNDLSTNNVLIKPSRYSTVGYRWGAHHFVVGVPLHAAIADFDFTHVPGHVVLSNERVLGGRYGITDAQNPSYDTHLFLKSMYKHLKGGSHGCPETLEFLRSLKLDHTERSRHTLPHLVPATLLRHPFFSSIRRSTLPACDVVYTMPS
jgi:hypothetical protein